MVYTVLGVQLSQGEFNGFAYDNTKLHCIFDSDSKYLDGIGVEIITISNRILNKLNPGDLMNKKIKVYYDKRGKVQDIVMVD